MSDHECFRCPECGSCPACAADALDRVIDEAESLRERLDQFEAYAMPNVATALDRIAAAEARAEGLEGAATEALAVLTRLADSASEWQVYALPAGIVSEVDAAKARLAAALAEEERR